MDAGPPGAPDTHTLPGRSTALGRHRDRVPGALPSTEHNHWQVIKEAFMRDVSG